MREIVGEIVFAVDDDTMESVVLALLTEQHLTLGLAESLTGGLIGARLTGVPGASSAFRGAIVPYDRQLKIDLLSAPDVPAVSKEMALAMAEGVCTVLGTDVGLAVTGVAGPAPLEGVDPGTVRSRISAPSCQNLWFSTIATLTFAPIFSSICK